MNLINTRNGLIKIKCFVFMFFNIVIFKKLFKKGMKMFVEKETKKNQSNK